MIIIEGPDGAGKTTLATMLEQDKVTYKALLSPKRAYPEDSLYQSTKKYCDRYLNDHRVSIDRFIFSELCYGPIKRGKIEFTHLQANRLIADILGCGTFIIFCLPDVNSLIFKVDEDPDTIAKIRQIHNEYFEWSLICRRLASHKNRILRYQWNTPGAYDSLKAYIRRTLANER